MILTKQFLPEFRHKYQFFNLLSYRNCGIILFTQRTPFAIIAAVSRIGRTNLFKKLSPQFFRKGAIRYPGIIIDRYR